MATPRTTLAPPPSPRPGPADAAAVQASLERILASSHFAHAPRLSRFLRYVVEETQAGRAQRIKEFTIAADVFDRGTDYDPASDAVVRVEASRLRQKLQAFYEGEGRFESLVIELPKGGYCPVMTPRPATPTEPETAGATPSSPAVAAAPASRHARRTWVVLAMLAGGLLFGVVAMVALSDRPVAVATAGGGTAADPTARSPANDPLLRGRYLRRQMTPASLEESVRWFERAAELDPTSAESWAALGEARATLLFHGLAPTGPGLRQAKDAIVKALALAPGLGEARGVLARLHLVYDRDWPAAEREFRDAIAGEPGNARLRQWFAFALVSRGRFDEALAESRRAQELSPDAYVGTTDLAVLLLFARRYDEALAQARQVHALNPSLGVAHVVEGMILAAMGRMDEALAAYARAADADQKFTGVLGRMGYAYARSGRTALAREQLDALDRLYAPQPAPGTERALVLVGLADHDGAFAALDEALARHEGEMLFFDVNPLLDPLRGDPRFAELRRKAGL